MASREPTVRPVVGTVRVPGDRAISHRAALLASLADGASTIRGYSPSGACAATLGVLAALGIPARRRGDDLIVEGRGLGGFAAPSRPLDCGRSATTLRLAAGVLAASPFESVLVGEEPSLRGAIDQVAEPLREMGAVIEAGNGLPVTIRGGALHGIEWRRSGSVADAKSAVLLAGLRARGETSVLEPRVGPDHMERLLKWAGGPIRRTRTADGHRTTISSKPLQPFSIEVPGDVASAAPILAAAAILPRSDVRIQAVGLNPTRTAFLATLQRMGVRVDVHQRLDVPEPSGDVRARTGAVRGIEIGAGVARSMSEELPLLAVVATQGSGVTTVRGGGADVGLVLTGLRAMGARIDDREDGFAVTGPTPLHGARVAAHGDPRVAVAFTVAGLVAEGLVHVDGMETVADSFPGFQKTLEELIWGSSR